MNKRTLSFVVSFILIIGTAACSGPPAADEDTTTTAVSPTTPPSPAPTETAVSAIFFSDEEAAQLMRVLAFEDTAEAEEALARVVAANDTRFIAVLIELMRARQIGIVRNLGFDAYIPAIETLSGQAFGNRWDEWVEWYGGTDLVPPPGFTSWKGGVLANIDPRFAEFLQDRFPSTIRVEEIAWGGVVVDGIPALTDPTMIAAADADYMQPWDAVFGIAINGDARAYPLRILDWHEMANDVVGGVPVSLAYCTLCGAAIAYDGRASDGNTYTFGSSGFLFRSNKLMYDRQTGTLWNQLTGQPVLGELVDDGVTLDLLPVVLTTWEEWQEQHPDTVIVDIATGYDRVYTPGAAYGDYFSADITMFPVWQRDDARETKDWVYALNITGIQKAYPIDHLAEARVVNDVLGDTAVTLIASRGLVEVDGASLRAGPVNYIAGAEVRAYNRGSHTFAPGSDADSVIDKDGNVWQITEEALVGPDGDTAPRINGHLAYWFGWFAFFPDTLVYAP
jgi:hypothetical protein